MSSATAVITLARLTFKEASRRRMLLAALILGLTFLTIYGVSFYFVEHALKEEIRRATTTAAQLQVAQRQFQNVLAVAGLYAVNFLALAMSALLSADTLAGEINSGAIQTIAAKPLRRSEIVLGKWLGFAVLLALYLLLMAGGVVLIVYGVSGYRAPHLLRGLALIYLNSLVVMSLTLASSSIFSTLATGGIVFGLYGLAFIGGWVEQIGAYLNNSTAVNMGILSSLLMPCEALWRLAAYQMTPPLLQSLGFGFSPFTSLSTPSALMVVYTGAYLLAALGTAIYRFKHRDL